jgi:hypothetical protein
LLFSTRSHSAGRLRRLAGRVARPWVSKVMAGVCAAALCLPLASALTSAQADPGTETRNQAHLEWDGPTLSWDWNGRQQETEELSFVGSRTVVPGDRSQRTLNVRNDGPTDAVATVRIVLPATGSADGSQTGGAFEDAVQLFWDFGGISDCRSWTDLRPQAGALVGEVPVARHDVVALTVGFLYPIDATGGRASEDPSEALTFDVLVTLRQSTDASPTPTPSPAPPEPVRPSPGPESPGPSDQGSTPSASTRPPLFRTGAQVLADPTASNGGWWTMLAVVLLVSGGLASMRSVRAWRQASTGSSKPPRP